jgi:hypothetical protein
MFRKIGSFFKRKKVKSIQEIGDDIDSIYFLALRMMESRRMHEFGERMAQIIVKALICDWVNYTDRSETRKEFGIA